MRVLQIGNFVPEHSTENHLLRAMRNLGWLVTPLQENDPATFKDLADQYTKWDTPDFVLWTRTGWPWNDIYPGGEKQALADQHNFLRQSRYLQIPVVGYHLDIWFGLKRVGQVDTEPFFSVDLLITADGGHDDEWKSRGINHHWMPPAVSVGECEPGMFRDEFRSEIAFVGNWQGGYHDEHRHRHELVRWLSDTYGERCAFWPKIGHHAVRGADLRDLYASVDVIVGDSCFAGQGLANYWSDRIPETTGRGGFLLHPDVPGLSDQHPMLVTWPAGDWERLRFLIDAFLVDAAKRRANAAVNKDWTVMHHTYEVRMKQLEQLLERKGML